MFGPTSISSSNNAYSLPTSRSSGTTTFVVRLRLVPTPTQASNTWVPPPAPKRVVKPKPKPGWKLPARTHRLVGTRHGFHQMARLPCYRAARAR